MVSKNRDARIMVSVDQMARIRSGEMFPSELEPVDYPGMLEFLANKIEWTNHFGGKVDEEFCGILRRIAGHIFVSETMT